MLLWEDWSDVNDWNISPFCPAFPWICLSPCFKERSLLHFDVSSSAPHRRELHSQTWQSLPVVHGQPWERHKRFTVFHVSNQVKKSSVTNQPDLCIIDLNFPMFLFFVPFVLCFNKSCDECDRQLTALCVQLENIKCRETWIHSFLPTNVLHFFSCRFV